MVDTKAIEAELAAANTDAAGQHRRQAKSWTHVRDLLARVKVLEAENAVLRRHDTRLPLSWDDACREGAVYLRRARNGVGNED